MSFELIILLTHQANNEKIMELIFRIQYIVLQTKDESIAFIIRYTVNKQFKMRYLVIF